MVGRRSYARRRTVTNVILIRRNVSRWEPIPNVERSVTLAGEAWVFALATSHLGLGWSYQRPARVEVDGSPPVMRPIHDYVMLARLGGFLLFAVALLLRRRQP